MHENDRIFEVLTELKQHAAVTNERLDWYNKSLDVHIKRTELLEKDMQTALLPIKSIRFMVGTAVSLTAVLGLLKLLGIITLLGKN